MLCRRAELLEESKHWITPETLEARKNEALDNPVELYAEIAEPSWKYKN